MKNLAELKRTLKPGVVVTMTHHDYYPNGKMINTPRVIEKMQSNAIAFRNPEDDKVSWLFFDNGAKAFMFDGTNKFSYILNSYDAEKPDYKPQLMTYEVNQ